MTWCRHCAKNSDTHRDDYTGTVCCVDCGKVVFQDVFTEDTQFVKDAAGGARLDGNLVTMQNSFAESRKRTLKKGNDEIYKLIDKYGIENVDHACKYYKIAVERGFTRGRRTRPVAAACLYIACRELEKPFLLIEFCALGGGVSVYELGTVYLQLCKLLSLQNHPFVQKPVDPSLFMHRYITELIKDRNNKEVLNTALHLAVSMKRDWIQTGRKPSGICAAAIYVASVLHGYNFSKTDVVKAVHICEATLTKRLIEFENTEAGSLTIDEFTQNAMDFEKDMQSCKQSANDIKMPGMTDVVCQHKMSAVQSGFGLCKDCYLEFCGGLDGSEPPAFQCAQVKRCSMLEGTQGNMKESENIGISTEVKCFAPNSEVDAFENSKEASTKESDTLDNTDDNDESDALDDSDDSEINGYILDEEESRYKTTIWELSIGREIRQDAKQKQAAAQVVPSQKKKYKRENELEAKIVNPQTAGEAACGYFKKKFGSKFSEEAIEHLFDEPVDGGESMTMNNI